MLSWRIRQWIGKMKDKLLIVKDKTILLARNKYVWVTASLILLFVSGFYINYSYTARVAQLQEKTEQQFSACEKNLISCKNNITTTYEQLTTCKSDLTKTQSNLTTCTAEKQQLEKQNKDISSDILSCQQTYSSLTSTYENLRTDYDLLAKNTATNICCKRKFDEPSLKYYYIDNNSIVCTSTASERTKEFVCPSLT